MTGVNKFGGTGDKPTIQHVSAAGRGINAAEINNLFLRRDGANKATGDLDMDNHRVLNITDPTEAQDIANKRYVDNTTVSNTGDTMSGNLILKIRDKPSIALGCNDLRDSKRFNVLLGSNSNLLQCQSRFPIVLQTTDGLIVRVCEFDTAQFSINLINLTRNIDMNT